MQGTPSISWITMNPLSSYRRTRLWYITRFSIVCLLLGPMDASSQTGFWKKIDGPGQGGFTDVLTSMGTPFLFAGNYQSGNIFRSTDDGASWQVNNPPGFSMELRGASQRGRLFAHLTERKSFTDTSRISGLYYSDDNGTTWIPSSWTSTSVYQFLPGKGDNVYLLANGDEMIYRSTDNGDTWSSLIRYNWLNTQLFDAGGGLLYVRHTDTLRVSVDNGATWDSQILPPRFPYAPLYLDQQGRFLVSLRDSIMRTSDTARTWEFYPHTFREISFLAELGTTLIGRSEGYEIVISHDGGETWSQTNIQHLFGSIVTSTTHGLYIFSEDSTIYRSTDGGSTWSTVTRPAEAYEKLVVSDAGHLFVAMRGSGISRSPDGGATWSEANHGYDNARIQRLLVSDDDRVFTWEDYSILRESRTDRNEWRYLDPGQYSGLQIGPTGRWYDGGEGEDYRYSTDHGLTWTPIAHPPAERFTNHLSVGLGETLFFQVLPGDSARLYRSDDHGTSWYQIQSPTNWDLAEIRHLSTGTLLCRFYDWDGYSHVLRSLDGGSSWQQVAVFMGDIIGVDNHGRTYIREDSWWGQTPRSFYVMTDDVDSLQLIFQEDGSDTGFSPIAVSPQGELFRVKGETLYKSEDLAQTWTSVVSDPLHIDFDQLHIGGDGHLYAGPAYGSLYRSAGTYTIVQEEPHQVDVPTRYQLLRNYPNPFNPSTTLSYVLPEAGSVTLTVYTLVGQAVWRMTNETLEAGYHSEVFDASMLPSGLYFYRMEAGSSENPGRTYTQTRKMVLVK